ncbi:MAG TPA: hypothetical protein VFK94_06515 [Patescibacteria group bacterium]|nr:hypothetical protein [Patescibacteria group bacterium]
MARRPLTGEVRVITERQGQVTEGYYLGSREVDTGKDKPQKAHAMEGKDGVFEFWGSAQIDNALSRVKKGTFIWITYQGMQPSRRGNMHAFVIEYDDETGGDEEKHDPDLPY